MRLFAIAVALCTAIPAGAETVRVADAAALAQAAVRAAPGDTIVLANGVWRDQPLVVAVQGAAGRPVTVMAETPGGVVLSGRTGLTIGGSHSVVSGIVFRDARSAGPALVAVGDDTTGIVLREIVVERASRPDRRDGDVWLALGGRGSAVEASRFVGKANSGATISVTGQDARIVGNHFAGRPMLGMAGGETIRVAPSARGAVIDRNLIEDCDGGPATMLIAGDGAVVRGNLVLRSQGAIVVTGSGARVERNVVRGSGEAHSGGIVLSGAGGIVRDNYLERLAAPAIAVTAGGAGEIAHNSVIDSARIAVAGDGAVRFADNLIRTTLDPFRLAGAGGRVVYTGNRSSFDPPAAVDGGVVRDTRDFVASPTGLLRLPDGDAGTAVDLAPLDRATVGPRWHSLAPRPRGFGSGQLVEVPRGGDLGAAVKAAAAGDTLHLADATYRASASIVVDRPLTITGPARIETNTATLFQIVAGGSLKLDSLTINGIGAPRQPGNAIVRSPVSDGGTNYAVMLDNVTVGGLTAPAFDVIATTPGSFATRIDIRGSRFTNVSGAIVAAAATEPGYRAALVRIDDTRFVRVGRVADVARVGGDGFGPAVEITDNRIERAGTPSLRLAGVDTAVVAGNDVGAPSGIAITGHDLSATITVRCNRGAGAVSIVPPVATPRVAPDWRSAVPCDWPR
ncbi:chondroitinase-B domain-containing protein [Sphingomonas sp. RS2018]